MSEFVLFVNALTVGAQVETLLETWEHTLQGQMGPQMIVNESDEFEPKLQQAMGYCGNSGAILVVAGGDGTVNSIACRAAKHGIPLGIIPLGTFNYFARSLEIPLSIEESIAYLKEADVKELPVSSCGGQPFFVNTSLGLYPRMIKERERDQKFTGRNRFTAVLLGLRTLLNNRRRRKYRFLIDGQLQEIRATIVMIIVNPVQLENIDARIPFKWNKLYLATFSQLDSLDTLSLILNGLRRRLLDDGKFHCIEADRIELCTQRKKIPAVIDGELTRIKTPCSFRGKSTTIKVVSKISHD